MAASVEEIEQAIKQWELKKWQEEQDSYLFNQPDALYIDMDFWARAATWTDEQAAMLSLDRHPLPIYLESIQQLTSSEIQGSEVAMNFFDRIALAESAREAGQVSTAGASLDFVRWFEQMDFGTRPDLIERVSHYQSARPKLSNAANDELLGREKQTLLKLVAAMAVQGYKFDPKNKRNLSTSDIKTDLELLGFPLDDKTILKWLRLATDLIDDEYWKSS